jgi:hypothetical protein
MIYLGHLKGKAGRSALSFLHRIPTLSIPPSLEDFKQRAKGSFSAFVTKFSILGGV